MYMWYLLTTVVKLLRRSLMKLVLFCLSNRVVKLFTLIAIPLTCYVRAYLCFLDKSAEATEPVQTAVLTEASLYHIHSYFEHLTLLSNCCKKLAVAYGRHRPMTLQSSLWSKTHFSTNVVIACPADWSGRSFKVGGQEWGSGGRTPIGIQGQSPWWGSWGRTPSPLWKYVRPRPILNF